MKNKQYYIDLTDRWFDALLSPGEVKGRTQASRFFTTHFFVSSAWTLLDLDLRGH